MSKDTLLAFIVITVMSVWVMVAVVSLLRQDYLPFEICTPLAFSVASGVIGFKGTHSPLPPEQLRGGGSS